MYFRDFVLLIVLRVLRCTKGILLENETAVLHVFDTCTPTAIMYQDDNHILENYTTIKELYELLSGTFYYDKHTGRTVLI